MTAALEVKIQRLHASALLPEQMSADAAGFDLRACLADDSRPRVPVGGELRSAKFTHATCAPGTEPGPTEFILPAGCRALVPTGLAMAIPPGYEGQVRPRSGLALRHGVSLVNSPGTIDADYRGEIGVILINHGQSPFSICHGDRIAQLVIAPVLATSLRFSWVESLSGTARAAAGFGSTGVNSS